MRVDQVHLLVFTQVQIQLELIFQVNKLSMQVRNMVIEVNSTNLKNLSLIIRKKNMTSLQ